MSIFTISRQMGSLGDEIAQAVAGRLNAPLLDRSALMAEPARYALPGEPVPLEVAERGPTLLERLGGERPRYLLALRSALYTFAASHEHVVIVGLGSQLFFASVRHALRVLLIAPFEVRVERVLAEFADRDAAHRAVRQQDRERGGYHQYVHHVDWLNPELYQLVVNTAQTRVETMAELLIRTAELPDYRLTPESRQALADVALTTRLETVLAANPAVPAESFDVRAQQGHVTVSGVVETERQRAAVEQTVRETPGVLDVTNDLAVLPRRTPPGL